MVLSAYLQGIGIGSGLIIAIGAQNAFVLTQSLRRNHHMAVAVLCACIDMVLITAGVAGMGALVSSIPLLRQGAALGGAVFLAWFGFRALCSALRGGTLEADRNVGDGGRTSLRRVLLATLAVSLLNPHVYLDTVVMLGGISANYPPHERLSFGAGASTASWLWFLALGSCGRVLAPLFRKPVAWRVLDASVCLVVWSIALSLARQAWAG